MSESHEASLPAYRSANELRFSHGMLQGGRLLSLGPRRAARDSYRARDRARYLN
jgi:hypothetical protein